MYNNVVHNAKIELQQLRRMKSNAYFFLIILIIATFIFGSHYKWYQNDIVLEKDGLQFIEISKSQTIIPHSEPIVFISENSDQKRVCKFMRYGRGFTKDIFVLDVPNDTPNNYYFIEAIKGNLIFQDTLKNVELKEMVSLVNWGKKFESRQLIQHALDSGVFGYIDTMPLIFLVLALPFFILLAIIDYSINLLLRAIKPKKSRILIMSVLLAFLLYLLSYVKLVSWYPSSLISQLLRNIIAIVPVFCLFQYWKKKNENRLEFWKSEFIKFTIIFVGIFILIIIGNELAYQLDVSKFNPIVRKPFFTEPDSLATGMAMSFAIGNLLNNIFHELINRRRERKHYAQQKL